MGNSNDPLEARQAPEASGRLAPDELTTLQPLGPVSAPLAILLPPRPSRTVEIAGVELTQATQYFNFNGRGTGLLPDDSIALVENKDLIIRVYAAHTFDPLRPVGSPGGPPVALSQPPGTITGVVDYTVAGGSPSFPSLSPLNGPVPAVLSELIDRGNVNATLNFRVPAADCNGTLWFTITVFQPEHPNDASFVSFPRFFSATFETVPPPRVHGVLIRYTGPGGPLPAPTFDDLLSTLALVTKVYPISYFNVVTIETTDFNGDFRIPPVGPSGCGVGWDSLFSFLLGRRSGNEVVVGLLPTNVPVTGVIGCGGVGAAEGRAFDWQTMAQEIGHSFSRQHAPCGGPLNTDPLWPRDFANASIGEFGLDTATMQVLSPNVTFDFMSYCRPTWVSPYTYDALRIQIMGANASVTNLLVNEGQMAELQSLFLNFRIHREEAGDRVELLPSYHLPGVPPLAQDGRISPIVVKLLDADGGVLQMHYCSLGPHDNLDGPVLEFHEVLPWHHETKSIAFVQDRREIHREQLAEPPELSNLRVVTEEEGDEEHIRLEWQATHSERAITCMVRYSPDGGQEWYVLATDLLESYYVVDATTLAGGEACIFQVAASSGVRTALLESQPVEIPRRPSRATILSPADGDTFSFGTPVLLQGFGFSPNFETSRFDDLVWASGRDGYLGTGYQVIKQDLSIGPHRITLNIPDNLGDLASASVQIRIVPD